MTRGVRVNCVAPGGIETPLQNEFAKFPEGVNWKEFRRFMSPLGNSAPEEIASTIAYVASDEARYMVGAIVSVDGGITI
jgi:NAD(P)-dependent dehydrogenase (short-subunit alcohol dehydrogenase family)